MMTIISSSLSEISQIPLPNQEIQEIFNLHNSLSQQELLQVFLNIVHKISRWLEIVHLAVFTLEQKVKQNDGEYQYKAELTPLEQGMGSMEPVILVLSELVDIVESKCYSETTKVQLETTKIQSEWSSLQHFIASVKKLVITQHDQKQMSLEVEQLLIQIDDVSVMIFDFQERKHAAAAAAIALPTSSLSDSEKVAATSSESTTTTTTDLFSTTSAVEQEQTKWLQNKDDMVISNIDKAFDGLLQSIERVYLRMKSQTQQQQQDSALLRRFEKAKEKWELLQIERDELKFEHKEDRWLAVFRRVADQVDVMIDGLDRSVVQCYTLIQQTRDWQASILPATPTSTFDKFSKSFLRSFHQSSPTSQQQQQKSNNATMCPPVDKEKFKSVEKSFEAKYKYYTPSIDRMLTMLGNGIASRASRDNTTSQRHESMIQRWNHLKEVMDELRMRDLVETERIILSSTTSTSSASSSPSSAESKHGWKGIRYRTTPEPSDNHNNRGRSITPNSNSRNSSIGRQSPRKSPIHQDYYHHQSLLRGSISDSSSVGSSPPQQQQQQRAVSRQTKTPRPTRNTSNNTNNSIISNSPTISNNNKEDFYDEDERYYGVDLMKLNLTNKPQLTQQKRAQSVERPIVRNTTTTGSRAKTPTSATFRTGTASGLRSKSSIGDFNRTRSVTPSLIPRPKTPKEEIPNSPMIPRPRSSMRQQQHHQELPPVPPIPKYATSSLYSENGYSAVQRSRSISKKQSMPLLRQHTRHTPLLDQQSLPPRSRSRQETQHRPSSHYSHEQSHHIDISFEEEDLYHADPRDLLDVEVAKVVNASPISIKCSRAQQGRYYFGNEFSLSSMGGKKLYTCKLMTYEDRRGQPKSNNVLIRVGGGWEQLEIFLLEHSSLMASDVVVRSFGSRK